MNLLRLCSAAAALAVALGAAGAGAQVLTPRLSFDGSALPPLLVTADAPVEVRVDPGADTVLGAHVLLQSMDGGAMMARDRDGFWAPYEGGPLPPAAALAEDGVLRFKVWRAAPRAPSRRYRVGLAYATPEGLKHGWADLIIDDATESRP